MSRRNQNVTFIDELQDLEDLDSSNNMEQTNNNSNDAIYKKYIRGHAMPPNESGMNLNNQKNTNTTEHYNQYMNQHSRHNSSMENYGNMNRYINVNDYVNPHTIPYSKQYMNGNMNNGNMNREMMYQDIVENNDLENENNVKENYVTDNLNCRDVARHVSNCPVCSKLYKQDKTMYWIIISILVIMCIIMFNKILECNSRFMNN